MLYYSQKNYRLANQGGNHLISSTIKSCHHLVEEAPISIKLPIAGEILYKLNGASYRINPKSYLLVNKGDHLETIVDSHKGIQGICIYLDENMVEDCLKKLAKSPKNGQQKDLSTLLQSGKYVHGHSPLSLLLQRISVQQHRKHSLVLYQSMASKLLRQQLGLRQVFAQLDSSDKLIQLELLNRVTLVKNYIKAHYQEDINIDHLSQIACLSKFHFIRVFKQVFGTTPYKMLCQERLMNAQIMIASGKHSIEEAALQNGFNQRRNFSRSFKSYFGYPPSLLLDQNGTGLNQ